MVSLPSISNYVHHSFSLDIKMGTVCFSILNINNPIRYFTSVINGKISASVYNFSEEAKK